VGTSRNISSRNSINIWVPLVILLVERGIYYGYFS